MIYYARAMKKFIRPALVIGTSLILSLSCAAITTYSAKIADLRNSSGAAFLFQPPPTPQPQDDRSEIGSTDDIIIMGGVIVLIVIVPILTQRKSWMRRG